MGGRSSPAGGSGESGPGFHNTFASPSPSGGPCPWAGRIRHRAFGRRSPSRARSGIVLSPGRGVALGASLSLWITASSAASRLAPSGNGARSTPHRDGCGELLAEHLPPPEPDAPSPEHTWILGNCRRSRGDVSRDARSFYDHRKRHLRALQHGMDGGARGLGEQRLAAPIIGKKRALRYWRQACAASWAVKTALVWELVEAEHRTVPLDVLRIFHQLQRPGGRQQVWIGHYQGSQPDHSFRRTAAHLIAAPPQGDENPQDAHANLLAVTIGQLQRPFSGTCSGSRSRPILPATPSRGSRSMSSSRGSSSRYGRSQTRPFDGRLPTPLTTRRSTPSCGRLGSQSRSHPSSRRQLPKQGDSATSRPCLFVFVGRDDWVLPGHRNEGHAVLWTDVGAGVRTHDRSRHRRRLYLVPSDRRFLRLL